MKSDSKNKNYHGKIHQHSPNNVITYATNTSTQPNRAKQTSQEQLCFHLNDEQPQSLNAKRKLEQFSVSLNEQKMVNLNNRNHHTINLLKKKTLKTDQQESQNIGWTDNQISIKQSKRFSLQNTKTTLNNKRIYSSTHNPLTKTIHVKQKQEKKSSFKSSNSPQKKLNLSFNNLMPSQMEIIRQQQISREIIKKVKNSQTKRPNTACYYGASQKILTLFDKDQQLGKKVGQTLRIHSVKDSQVKSINVLTLKDRQRILKTCNSFYINENSKFPQQKNKSDDFLMLNKDNDNKNDKKILSLKQSQKKGQRLITQSKQNILKNSHHFRTYSQPIDDNCKKRKYETNDRNTLSHRKYQMISDRKSVKRSWGMNKRDMKDQQDINSDRCNYQSARSINNNKQQNQLIQTNQSSLNNNTASKQLNSNSIQTTNNLQQDFTLLTNLLKQQNQHIFGGQLHNYLTQVKNNYHYNYYMSSTINKKHHSRNSLNQSIRLNKNKNKTKTQTNKNKNNNIATNQNVNQSLTNDNLINQNNTTRHYTPFSASKHKSKTNNFIIPSSQIV